MVKIVHFKDFFLHKKDGQINTPIHLLVINNCTQRSLQNMINSLLRQSTTLPQDLRK